MALDRLQIYKDGMKKTEAPSKYFGYSTCTVSEAAGRIYGFSKREKLDFVKMPDYSTASLAEIMWSIRERVLYRVNSVKPEAL